MNDNLTSKEHVEERIVALQQVLASIEKHDAWDYFKRGGWAGDRLYALLAELRAENEPKPVGLNVRFQVVTDSTLGLVIKDAINYANPNPQQTSLDNRRAMLHGICDRLNRASLESSVTSKEQADERMVALRQVLASIEKEDAWDYFKRGRWAGDRLYALLADLETPENEPSAALRSFPPDDGYTP